MLKMKALRMNWKITILTFGIVLFAICIGGIILIGRVVHLQEEELGQRLLVTARTVAQLPSIISGVSTGGNRQEINPIAERIRIINDVDYIVVMDMAGIRWSHPASSRIGEVSQGSDEHSAFAEHTYLSKANGEQGTAIRAFVPVMNEEHEQVGVVLVGELVPGLAGVILAMRGQIYVTVLLSLLFGVWGSWMLSRHIKEQMFQLEPEEIAQLLVERTATFNAMHEGVIAIDRWENITVFNDKAKSMLQIVGDVLGRPIREVLPDTRLPEILQLNHPIFNQEIYVGGMQIFSNRVPIKLGHQTVGAVAIFQDRTEVTKIAEELTGVKAFVDALRVQNHEYMNKLHTIGGLIQLDHKQKALDYLFQTMEAQSELSGFVSSKIADENVAGLLIGKISRGKELGIEVRLDRGSRMMRFPKHLDHHDVVVILGNLIENAFDALKHQEETKEVFISLEQDDEVLSILVEDNGSGMDEETKQHIFERGYSTKSGGNRGIGLYLISNIVSKCGGHMGVESKLGQGTSIMLTFPMIRGERDSNV
ncbi:two-component system sensor histidine kinase DctS [Paenibacillus aceris]|uniref:histidine kinase n=2 Tax=Paenibacillus aceris TaxID=869555 RepID=A0ABS4HWB6_9BACL|nr:two-component system sensor histidine kinase DctS [Paenibacillus aceris]